jgi:hypothetical protein
MAAGVRATLVLLTLFAVPLSTTPARSGDFWSGVGDAGLFGGQDLEACRMYSGKVLYDCFARVLDMMSSVLRPTAPPGTRSALQAAALQVRVASNKSQRVASNKAQALTAIVKCRSVYAGLAQQATEAGKQGEAYGLNAVAGVMTRAGQLIRQKG